MKDSAQKKILLVDDDELALQIMQIHLVNGRINAEIRTASHGKEALETAVLFEPDVIISDWEMPVMTGVELCRALKENVLTKDIPVIIATGIMTTDNNLDQAFEAGAVDYVRKPVNDIELLARVRSVLATVEYQEQIKLQNEMLQEHREELEAINNELRFSNYRLSISESRYKHLSEASLEGIVSCNETGEILNYNPQILLFFGTPHDNILKNNINTVFKEIPFSLENPESKEFQLEKSENIRYFNMIVRKIENESEYNFIVVVQDVTALKHLEILQTEKLEDKIRAEKEINRLQKEKYEADIAHKNRQLTSTTLQVNNKNCILEEIQSVMNEIKDKAPANPTAHYRKILYIIKDNLNLDKDWDQFRLHFDEVHPDFFDGLKRNFPALSEADLKHCAYMRIGFSTKEIARLLNVTPRSVQVSRYRMKKKMNLPEEDDLRDAIKVY
ncbi:MAG: hypothetical protein RIS47_527 [Bacteroidota bacterium]